MSIEKVTPTLEQMGYKPKLAYVSPEQLKEFESVRLVSITHNCMDEMGVVWLSFLLPWHIEKILVVNPFLIQPTNPDKPDEILFPSTVFGIHLLLNEEGKELLTKLRKDYPNGNETVQ